MSRMFAPGWILVYCRNMERRLQGKYAVPMSVNNTRKDFQVSSPDKDTAPSFPTVPPVRRVGSLLSPERSSERCQARFESQTETVSQAGLRNHWWHILYQTLLLCIKWLILINCLCNVSELQTHTTHAVTEKLKLTQGLYSKYPLHSNC